MRHKIIVKFHYSNTRIINIIYLFVVLHYVREASNDLLLF